MEMEPYDAFSRAFIDACHAGDLSKTKEAIASGRLTVEDLNKGLKRATSMAHPDIVAALFDAGASVSIWSIDSLPGKDLQQDPSVIRHYLDHGLDPNATLSNGEPLLLFFLNPVCAHEMLSRGADPNLCGPRGITPLARAIVSTHEADTSLLELLIAHGAKLDSDLLFFAASPRLRQGELMTRFLLAKGLDPNVVSEEWGTPLHCAIRSGKPNIVKLLLDAGANPIARSAGRKTYGHTPLQTAEMVQHPGARKAILDLLQSRQGSG